MALQDRFVRITKTLMHKAFAMVRNEINKGTTMQNIPTKNLDVITANSFKKNLAVRRILNTHLTKKVNSTKKVVKQFLHKCGLVIYITPSTLSRKRRMNMISPSIKITKYHWSEQQFCNRQARLATSQDRCIYPSLMR